MVANPKEVPQGKQDIVTQGADSSSAVITDFPGIADLETDLIVNQPTEEEVRAANAGEYAPKGIPKKIIDLARNMPTPVKVIAGLGAATTVGAAAFGIHERINAQNEVPSAFNNNDDRGVFGDNNINRGDLSEFQNQFPEQIIEKDTSINFVLPFILPEGTSASYVKNLSDRLPTEELQQQAKAENIKNNIDLVLPKNTVIISPVNGHGAIGFGIPEAGQDSTKAYGTAIVFYDQSVNRTYLIKIFSLDQTPFEPIKNMSRYDNKRYFRDTGWKDLPKIDRITPLMQTQRDNQQVRISIEAYEGEKIGPEAAITNKDLYLLTPRFFTTKDSSGREHLFMVLQKN